MREYSGTRVEKSFCSMIAAFPSNGAPVRRRPYSDCSSSIYLALAQGHIYQHTIPHRYPIKITKVSIIPYTTTYTSATARYYSRKTSAECR